MTVAVIADAHGNRWALDAVLADAQARGAADGTYQRELGEMAAWLDGIDAPLILCGHTQDWAIGLETGWPGP